MRQLLYLVVGLLWMLWAGGAQAQTTRLFYDFSRGTAGNDLTTMPTTGTTVGGALAKVASQAAESMIFSSGTVRAMGNSTGAQAYFAATGLPQTDYDVYVDITMLSQTGTDVRGLLARMQAPSGGAYNAEVLDYYAASSQIRLYHFANGVGSTVVGTNIPFTAGNHLYLWLNVTGTTATAKYTLTQYATLDAAITANVWSSAGSETMVGTVATTAGYAGLAGFGNAGGVGVNTLKATTAGGTATDFGLSGSTSLVTNATGSYTVTFSPGNPSATGALTLSDGGVGGTFSPVSPLSYATTDATKTFTWTPASGYSGTPTLTVTATGGGALAGVSHTLGVSVLNAVAFSDTHIFYSPYNWRTASTFQGSSYPGAYFKTKFTGTSCQLQVDASALSGFSTSQWPRLMASVDNGAWLPATQTNYNSIIPVLPYGAVDASNNALISVVSGLASGTHTLEVLMIGNDNTQDIWTTPTNEFRLKAIVIDASASLAAPTLRTKRALFWGDSITASYLLLAPQGAGGGLLYEDARLSWMRQVAQAFDCEYGTLGIGSQGWVGGGYSGGAATYAFYNTTTPANSSWNRYSAGVAISFTTVPDYAFCAQGTNDTNWSGVQSAAQAFVTAFRTTCPTTGGKGKLFVLAPYGQTGSAIAANISAGVTAAADSSTYFLSLGLNEGLAGNGNPSLYSWDGLHPNAAGHARIAAAVTQKAQAAIGGTTVISGTKRKVQ